ncbi:MAG TPA: hypothetical protein VGD62_06560, partial [Acidobacteriaceae bacterium]
LFSAAGTRLPHYIAPTYPALSALTAAFLAARLQRRRPLPIRSSLALTGTALLLYLAATLLTAPSRKALHSAQSSTGYITPDNRESIALLQQLQHTSTPLPPGPLLVWRQNPIAPLTTDAFYARRLALQVSLAPPPDGVARDPYFNDPLPLSDLLATPHLVLLDRSLLAQLPPGTSTTLLATGPTQELAILQLHPSSTQGQKLPTSPGAPRNEVPFGIGHNPATYRLTQNAASDKLI